jgi:hypothetical protein
MTFGLLGTIFGVAALGAGLLTLVWPKTTLEAAIWQYKYFFGAKFIPSKKTEMVYRFMGLLLALIGACSLYLTRIIFA